MEATRMNIEVGKLYKTRDGRKVRIYAVDGANLWLTPTPIHGAWMQIYGVESEKGWRSACWQSDGYYGVSSPPLESSMDIVAEWREPIKGTRVVYAYLYSDGDIVLVSNIPSYDRKNTIGVRKITVEVNEGDTI